MNLGKYTFSQGTVVRNNKSHCYRRQGWYSKMLQNVKVKNLETMVF